MLKDAPSHNVKSGEHPPRRTTFPVPQDDVRASDDAALNHMLDDASRLVSGEDMLNNVTNQVT